jgi:HD-GYP domain-containing protein (c-di-GMP phosphodiesterase class II)
MLAAISRALEERDQTHGHGARVASLAEPIAYRLGWNDAGIAALRFGGPLHDIGKVGVRRNVLLKSGPLTVEELSEIRLHPRAGAQLVLPLRDAWQALPYVLFHHEWWNGGGYPTGMRGRAIPEGARLLAVADAFDAMTSSRPYRHALTCDRALLEIDSCAGTQFDPHIAGLFCEFWSSQPVAAAS